MATNEKKYTVEELLALNKEGKIKERTKSNFYTYMTLERVEEILDPQKNNFFCLNPISEMNDPAEKILHGESAESTFALCFCNSNTENIPLWYLYGGITGEGARIGLTPTKMQVLIDSIKCVYPVWGRNPDLNSPLTNYELHYGWVYYYTPKGYISYMNHGYTLEGGLEDFIVGNFFAKKYPWNYEKEFRIIFKFNTPPAPKIAIKFNREDLLKRNGLSITLAPALSAPIKRDQECGRLANKLNIGIDRVKISTLDIEMNLLRRNKERIKNNFSKILGYIDPKEHALFCEQLKEYNSCSQNPTAKKEPSRV